MMNLQPVKNLSRGLLFILSAPAGTGKTTLVERITKLNNNIVESVSFTTRPPRIDEIQGAHYNFVSQRDFERKITENEFLEYAEFCDHFYGTSRQWVEEKRQQGKHVILTIETQGGLYLKDKSDAIYIFILPPSLEEQQNRLKNRKTETDESIKKRVEKTALELQAARYYDYVIVNDNLDLAYNALISIITAEEHRVSTLLKDPLCPKLLKI